VRIEVRLFATLARYFPKGTEAGSAYLDVPAGSSVGDAADALGIPADLSRTILVNDQDADENRRLVEGDIVTLFPPLAGGACR